MAHKEFNQQLIREMDLLCACSHAVLIRCVSSAHTAVLQLPAALCSCRTAFPHHQLSVSLCLSVQYGDTALHRAARLNRLQILHWFLLQRINCNAPNFSGETALMAAAGGDAAATVRALLDANADPSLRNKQGKTALLIARERGNVEIIVLLEQSLRPPAPTTQASGAAVAQPSTPAVADKGLSNLWSLFSSKGSQPGTQINARPVVARSVSFQDEPAAVPTAAASATTTPAISAPASISRVEALQTRLEYEQSKRKDAELELSMCQDQAQSLQQKLSQWNSDPQATGFDWQKALAQKDEMIAQRSLDVAELQQALLLAQEAHQAQLADKDDLIAQMEQLMAQKDAEHQATHTAYASECGAHHATQSTLASVQQELAQFKAAAATAHLQQTAQGLVGKGHRLTLDDICVLVQFWKLEIKLDVLCATALTLQSIFENSPVTLRRRLSCSYGTAVALVCFLHALADNSALHPPSTSSTEMLDSALQHANCPLLKPLFERQGVVDHVLFDIDLDFLAGAHDEIADHLTALQQAIQGLRSADGARLLLPSISGQLLLKSE
eukprot:m.130057 g.130057  ORF g.130057 m.130057 type:complete len:556 (-) comp52330_c2_seq20:103-1770(-)